MHAQPDYSIIDRENSEFSTSISLRTGFLYGTIGEYLYSGKQRLSKLNWDVKPMIYIGNVINASFGNGIIAGLGYWTGMNKDMGSIEDTDWDHSGIITSISVHNCVLIKSRFFDAYAGYSFHIVDKHQLSFQLGYSYQKILLEARDGYAGYPPTPVEGIFVQYEQKYNIPYVGANWNFRFFEKLYSTLSCIYGPYIFCNAIDNHVSRNIRFNDTFKGADYVSCGLLLGWRIDSDYLLSLSGNYSFIEKFRGDTYSVDSISGARSITYNNGAAISLDVWKMELAFGVIFGWGDNGSSKYLFQ